MQLVSAAAEAASSPSPSRTSTGLSSTPQLSGKRLFAEEEKVDLSLLKDALTLPKGRMKIGEEWEKYITRNVGSFTDDYHCMEEFANALEGGDLIGKAKDLPDRALKGLLNIAARLLGKATEGEGTLEVLEDVRGKRFVALLTDSWNAFSTAKVFPPPEGKEDQEKWLNELPPTLFSLIAEVCRRWRLFQEIFSAEWSSLLLKSAEDVEGGAKGSSAAKTEVQKDASENAQEKTAKKRDPANNP